MIVRYTGRNNIFLTEYNGKRYCFHKGGDAIDIPIQAYDMIKQSGHVDAQHIVPVQNEPIGDKDVMENLIKENNLYIAEIKELKAENKKLNEKLSKIKEKSDGKKK